MGGANETTMTETEAIGFIGSMCVRMFGLLVVIAENVVPEKETDQYGFVEKQRKWLEEQQSMLEIGREVDDALEGRR